MDITLSNKVLEINKVRKARKTTEVFRFGNRDGSHIEIVVSPSSQTSRRICDLNIPIDEAQIEGTRPHNLIPKRENDKTKNQLSLVTSKTTAHHRR